MLDDLDRQILHALQIDGRVAFSRVAEVLGVSDQTVTRRYRRLRNEDDVRVIGNVDSWRIGVLTWHLRIQCVPDAALSIAEALARRPDTSWVRLGSGGTEISCSTRARTMAETDALLLQKLHRTPRIVGIGAHCLIHMYFGGDQSFLAKMGVLAADQIAELTPAWKQEGQSGPVPAMDAGDRAMLAVLSRDGRAGYAELARATGWSESTVRRRLTELRRSGVVFFDVDVPAPALGMQVEAMLWLSVAPQGMVHAAETLAAPPAGPFVAATTGPHNIVASLVCRDVGALYEYLTTRVAAIPAIQRVETSPIVRTFKREGALL
jgi:DNA-binding Lrp family transcriptional regulator